jgi:hypothetical protein
MGKLKGKRIAGEPGTIEYGGHKIYNNKGEGGANYLIYQPDGSLDDGANTLSEAKAIVEMYLGKYTGGLITKKNYVNKIKIVDNLKKKKK